MNRLQNKVAIITGGAMGIGEADVTLFAREGAKVVVADIADQKGEELAKKLREEKLEVTYMHLDVSNEENWKKVCDETVKKYGKINILVNNAGISLGKDICDTSLVEYNRVMGINATGVFLGDKTVIEYMKDNGEKNSIVNRSSIDGQIGESGLFAYCASKGAVTLMTKCAALACGERHYPIRVNSVHPGYVATSLTEKEAADHNLTPDEYYKIVGEQHPIGYIGTPLDIAYADIYLASDESMFVTGSELTIDGGWTCK